MKLKVCKSGNSLVLRVTEWCRMHKVEKDDVLIAKLNKIYPKKKRLKELR